MDTYFVRRDSQGVVVCASCTGLDTPATHVSTYEKTDGSGPGAWAVCDMHSTFGLIAFGSLIPIAEFEASLTKESSDGAA